MTIILFFLIGGVGCDSKRNQNSINRTDLSCIMVVLQLTVASG